MEDNMTIVKRIPVRKNERISNEDVIKFINGRKNVLGELGLIFEKKFSYLDIIDINRLCTVDLKNVTHRILSVYEDDNNNLYMDVELEPTGLSSIIMKWLSEPNEWEMYGIVRAIGDENNIEIITIDIAADGKKPVMIF